MRRSGVVLVALIAGFAPGARAQHAAPGPSAPTLGTIRFPTSGRPEAQEHFLRGVALLHSFEYESAARAFRRAQTLDSAFAMAYWGEALTHTHPVWNQQDREAAHAVLARLAPTEGDRQARAPTQRERAYLRAVEILYGDGPKARRDTLYAQAMGRLVEAYPDDPEGRAFYALALLGLNQGVRDVPTYMRAARHALEVFEENPDHPGAAHYIIHSFDDPVHAPLGLKAARAYSRIAPDAAHAQHMTSHIFVAMGLWDDVVRANEQATAVVARAAGRSPVGCGHYNEWLSYGYMQQGRIADARRLVMDCAGEVAAGRRGPGSLAEMRSRHQVDSRDWSGSVADIALDTARVPPYLRGAVDLAAGLGAVERSDPTGAAAALRRMESRRPTLPEGDRGQAEVMERTLRAAIWFAQGKEPEALEEGRRAAELEEGLPYEFGPPASFKPPRELLGELHLAQRRFSAARAEFERALARTPDRVQSLLGLARAASGEGAAEKAARAYRTLAAAWRNADADFAARREVEERLQGGGR